MIDKSLEKSSKEHEKWIREIVGGELAKYEARIRELIREEISKWDRERFIPRFKSY